MNIPTRLPVERFWLFGLALALIAFVPQAVTVLPTFAIGDWSTFHDAGGLVGSARLISPAFPYMPGVAWLCAPLAHLSVDAGYALTLAVTLLAALAAAWVAAKVYGLDRRVAVLLTFAWAPTIHSVMIGQNATLGLLLMICATAALIDRRVLLAGLAVGLLLYKPTYAAAFVVLLLARREWRALGIVALCGIAWYLVSVAAVGGEWAWPVPYVHSLASWYHGQFGANAFKALSLPSLLERFGVPTILAGGFGVALLLSCIPKLARVPLLEAASIAPMIGLATSPHAWEYDACLLLPTVFWALSVVREPWCTRLICIAFVTAMLWPISGTFGFDPLAVLVVGGAAYWITRRDGVASPP